MQVLCKLLAEGLANKTIHDIMHVVLGEERLFYVYERIGAVLVHECLSIA